MNESIEQLYFDWLSAKVISPDNDNYRDLLNILYTTEFHWIVPGDENRAADGVELRSYFMSDLDIDPGDYFDNVGCSVFEMLWALSERADFQTSNSARDWFWEFIANLDLGEFRRLPDDGRGVIDDILHTFLWRLYDPSGYGGLFPMRWPKEDQTKVQIWDQFADYLVDQGRY